MSGADTWMPFYVGDYLADTVHLSTVQHGAYLLLLMGLWRGNGVLPDSAATLAAITKSTPQEWKRLRPVLEKFCLVSEGVWRHKRLTRELEKSQTRYATKVANGKLGGRPSRNARSVGVDMHDTHGTDPLATGSVKQSDWVPQPQPQPQDTALGVGSDGRNGGGGASGRARGFGDTNHGTRP
jgi:uncharacterized protein YdaU (DUF1376 family)